MAHTASIASSAGSRRRRKRSNSFGNEGERDLVAKPILIYATDALFWITLVSVTICFGGRAAIGQAVLGVGSSLTAMCWLLHLSTSSESRYCLTKVEWLWCLAILVAIVQIV